MTSQIESFSCTQYTPLYEIGIKEQQITSMETTGKKRKGGIQWEKLRRTETKVEKDVFQISLDNLIHAFHYAN